MALTVSTMAAAARSALRLLPPRSTLRSSAIRPAVLSATSQLHTSSQLARPAGKGDQGV